MDLTKVDLGSCPDRFRRRMDVGVVESSASWIPSVHLNCPHNEIAAVAMRSLAPLPRPVDYPLGAQVLRTFARLEKVAGWFSGERWSYLETAHSYTGLLRRRYVEAERSLRQDGPIRWRDSELKAFLKAEKIWCAGKFPKPRMIYPRSPRYNLALASRLKPFEHWLWRNFMLHHFIGPLDGWKPGRDSRGRIVMKGLSPVGRASVLYKKFTSFEECVCFEVDGKAFEAHVSTTLLAAEHAVYKKVFSRDTELARLLRMQERLVGTSSSGVGFSRPAGRASGDFNTGMGNSLIMSVVVIGVLREYGVPFNVAVDGDNALVFLSRENAGRVVQDFQQRVLDASGLELTLERPVCRFEEVRFGRSAPVFNGRGLGYTMVRDYRNIISGATGSHRHLRDPRFASRYLHGIARCELSLAVGIPVLQSYATKLFETTDASRPVPLDRYGDYTYLGAWLADLTDCRPISWEARVSFARAFGLQPDEQIEVEKSFKGYVGGTPVEFSPPITTFSEADPGVAEVWADDILY
jgi:hypothetical protein